MARLSRSRAKSLSAAGRLASFAAILLAASAVSACVSEKPAADPAASAQQPRRATYVCGDDGTLDVENMRTSVRLVDPDGDNVELPASPADQTSRYGQTPYALLLDGKEALYMKAGREPLTCLR